MTAPERGDLIVLDFDPQSGHEQMKRRPALVLSPSPFNSAFGLAFVVPVSTKPRGHAFEIPLPETLRVRGVLLVHQVKSLDWRARRARRVGKAPDNVVELSASILRDIVS